MKPEIPAIDVAKACHEVNRAYCKSIGDDSQPPWESAPEWQRQSAVSGVNFHRKNLDLPSPARASHENWMAEKLAAGWKFGEVKDAEKKTHPCITSYDSLPPLQRAKDDLFVAVVKALS